MAAFLATDVAAGSSAARTLQQNVYGAQYDQANNAAAAQEAQLKVQREQANVEKTRLGNLIANVGYKQDSESTAKLQAWYNSPEGQKADDVQKIQKAAAFKYEAGLADQGAALSKEAATLEGKKIADQQKALDVQAQVLGGVDGILKALKTPEEKENFFNEMKTRKPEEYKKMVDLIGPDTFEKMAPDEKSLALSKLALSAKGHLQQQKAENNELLQAILEDGRNFRAQLTDDRLRGNRTTGDEGSKEKALELRASISYARSVDRIDKSYKAEVDAASAAVKRATDELPALRLGGVAVPFTGGSKTNLDKAIENQRQLTLKILNEKLDKLELLPESDYKSTHYDSLMNDIEKVSNPPPPPPPSEVSDKPDVTSNKGADPAQEAKALAWAKANPNDPRAVKYLKEKAGGSGGTTTPAPSAAPTPAAVPAKATSGSSNPYVDTKGRPTGKAPTEEDTGSPLTKTIAPAVSGAVKSVGESLKGFTGDAQKKYLLSKLADGTATPAEKERARRLGLM